MNSELNHFRTTLAHKIFNIVGEGEDAELRATTRMLNNLYKEIEEQTPKLDVSDRSILLAFNAIHKQLIKQEEVSNQKEKLKTLREENRRLKEMIKNIESQSGDDPS